MLELVPKRGTGAELGVFRGDFSKVLLAELDPDELVLIDIGYRVDMNSLFASEINSRKIKVLTGDSSETLQTFPDDYFDWIYIDGDHSLGGVRKDAHVSEKKVKKRWHTYV